MSPPYDQSKTMHKAVTIAAPLAAVEELAVGAGSGKPKMAQVRVCMHACIHASVLLLCLYEKYKKCFCIASVLL